MRKSIVMIGSGNVATHLCQRLQETCQIVQVYSRCLAHAERLASLVGASATDNLTSLVPSADIYIICVPDDVIADVVSSVPDNGALWLHTSGTTPLGVLQLHRVNCGVLYPMQSFSRELPASWNEVHVFVEGSNEHSIKITSQLAEQLSPHVISCDSEMRRTLHVAAVFSCNFTNHMWVLASELLEQHGLKFDSMLPLIRNTVNKLDTLTPLQSQTGPAQRGDNDVISRHLSMLAGRPQEIYRLLSESIMEHSLQNSNP